MSNKKQNNNILKNTINSLYEVENFLCKFNKISDILAIAKVIKKTKKHK